jgi:hypothetical protein
MTHNEIGHNDTPDTVHGRLMEAVHIGGYSLERAFSEFLWLLKEDRWKKVGKGFDDIRDFQATLCWKEFNIAVSQRKEIAKLLDQLGASQRSTAKMLGVDPSTVNRDLSVANATPALAPASWNADPARLLGETAEGLDAERHWIRNLAYTGDYEWYTPGDYIESVRRVLGTIDLDSASCAHAQRTVKAARYFSESDNGLLHEWAGNVFLNPPYVHPLVAELTGKLCREHLAGSVRAAVLIVNSSTGARWWHDTLKASAAVCFTLGRIPFYKVVEGDNTAPVHEQSIFYFGHEVAAFADEFSRYGALVSRLNHDRV